MYSFMEYDREFIENEIGRDLVSYSSETDQAVEIMRYSALGGKKLRGIMTLEFAEMLGEKRENAVPYAMGVEYIQSYSLIHDDLPCMDNDDVRRGKPSSHVRFGYANALLGGDALLTHAFSVISESKHAGEHPDRAVKAIACLSSFAGYRGMVSGQIMDLESENREIDPKFLHRVHMLKTAALFKAAVGVGCAAAGANDDITDICTSYAENFGLAFQIIDDILDCGSDYENCESSSYVKVNGLAKASIDAQNYLASAKSCLARLSSMGYKTEALEDLLKFLLERMNLEI